MLCVKLNLYKGLRSDFEKGAKKRICMGKEKLIKY